MFSQLTSAIINIYKSGEYGVHVGVPHNEIDFHKYLADSFIVEADIKRIYLEISSENLALMKEIAVLARNKNHDIAAPLIGINYFLAVALMKEITIVPIDVNMPDPTLARLQGQNPATMQEVKAQMQKRISCDEYMATCIKNDYLAGNAHTRHLILTGSIHSGLAKKIQVKNFNVFERNFLYRALSESGEISAPILKTIPVAIFLYSSSAENQRPNLLYNNSEFYSPSKHATLQYPYGPYKDKYCVPKEDPQVEEGIALYHRFEDKL